MKIGAAEPMVVSRLQRRLAPAALAITLVLGACAPPRAEPTAAPTQAATSSQPSIYRRAGAQGTGRSVGPIARIGAAVSLSGPAAAAGMAQRNGIKLAQDEINASHLLDPVRLEVIVEDDASSR